MRRLSLSIIAFTLLGACGTQTEGPVVRDFTSCVIAGMPMMESQPRQCRGPDGTVYVEEEKTGSISITKPRPNDRLSVSSTTEGSVAVEGKARGSWFFEANFPIVVQDMQGKMIGQGVATADGEWMTDAFVPFHAEIPLPAGTSGKAVVILKKDNPSGLPENDEEVRIPVEFLTGK